MPTINPNLLPTIPPGQIFSEFINNQSLSLRWLTSHDPVFFESVNRPIADMAVRQLIMAKAIDQINLRLGYQTYFPFIDQPKLISGTNLVELPLSWIWDMNVSIPEKWKDLRLAKIKRISGVNMEGGTGGTGTDGDVYNGVLRLFFTATVGSALEYYLFYVDYDIASPLAYQASDITVVTTEESNPIPAAEQNTISGQVIFRTLDVDDAETRLFFDNVPPTDLTDSNSDGIYDNPASYEIASDEPGLVNNSPISHGSGLLTDSAWNRLPDLGANVDSWIAAFNYPFRVTSSRQSYTIVDAEPISIPSGLFTEFNMTAPAGDNDPADYNSYPVWVPRIKMGTLTNEDPNYITFFFATYNIKDDNTSLSPIEFGYLTLNQNGVSGDILPIEPMSNLLGATGSNSDNFNQQFGRGHVVLSSKWGTSEVIDFFDKFPLIVGVKQAEFTQLSTIISPFGLSRCPKYTPTRGQNKALAGSTSRRNTPVHPSEDNLYITEADRGIGDTVDLHAQVNPINGEPILPNPDIEQYGYDGSNTRRLVTLVVNAGGASHSYEQDVLPRLRCLLGEFQHGDIWMDGTRFKTWDSLSQSWVG